MKAPWHIARPDLRNEIESVLRESYPDLLFMVLGDTAKVRGAYPIRDVEGVEITRFAVEFEFTPDYPQKMPIVRETAGRIPRTQPRHVNVDGTACVAVPEEWLIISQDSSFKAFLEGPVRNFFLGQALVENGQPWPFGERAHGGPGVLEAYGDLMGVTTDVVKAYVEALARHPIKGHLPCPCGSKSIIRKCHRSQLEELRERISAARATSMLEIIARYFK